MKILKKQYFIGFVVLLVLVGIHSSSFALSLGFSPEQISVSQGNLVDMKFLLSGLPDTMKLEKYELGLIYDPLLLSINQISWGDVEEGYDFVDPAGTGARGIEYISPGIAHIFQERGTGPGDSSGGFFIPEFGLFTMTFDALAAGTSALRLSVNVLRTTEGDSLIPDNIGNGSVVVTAAQQVPVAEPTTFFLLVFALSFLGLMRGRKLVTC